MENSSTTPTSPVSPVSQNTGAAPQPAPTAQQAPQQPPVRPVSFSENNASASTKGSMKGNSKLFAILCVVVVLAGAGTGMGLNKLNAKSGDSQIYKGQKIQRVAEDPNAIQKGQVFGSANETDFKDSAEGYLELGGIDGEGSHRLLREGGISQTVYLTSSVTDLSKFEGMCVKVWGETFKAQKAGWLMDVGRVQIQETKCQAPAEE